jgi:hypothetical protein
VRERLPCLGVLLRICRAVNGMRMCGIRWWRGCTFTSVVARFERRVARI